VYSIEVTDRAEKQLLALDARTRARVEERIDGLAEWPNATLDVKPLRGRRAGQYRLRVGKYRIIFLVDEGAQLISVREIAPRGSAYR